MKALKDEKELFEDIPKSIAVVPINDGVVFPYMLVPLMLSDADLVGLIDEALDSNKIVGVFTQKDSEVNSPGPDDIFSVGCAMLIQKMARFPDGHIRIIGQGLSRVRIEEFISGKSPMKARISIIKEKRSKGEEIRALVNNTQSSFIQVLDKSDKYPEELKNIVSSLNDPGRLADLIASNLALSIEEKQNVLEIADQKKRLRAVYGFLDNELEIAKIGEKIKKDMHKEMDREQREYFLRKEMKAIQKELGDDDVSIELEELREAIEEADLTEEAYETALEQLNRLSRMSPSSSEYIVSRTYLDWILEIPWKQSTEDVLDIEKARKILDQDHYDLDTVKERILEFLSVRKLKGGVIGSILCFVGPPGVGKTSLGRSIARALGRKFVRISLGGVRDEAEIRGHRRTYIGALPGRIIQGIKNAGSNNPVFMLDEIDKLGRDYRGDPTSALLEVLDPEQNYSFEDHYINLPFDLSKVLFITTSNIQDTIPHPLLDRMEVMEIPGYITHDKLKIAKKFLLPKQMEENGIPKGKIEITSGALEEMIEYYTREAGVRNLERSIAAVSRKVARKLADGKRGPYRITERNLKKYLGKREYPSLEKLSKPQLGVATGMAKSSAGGVILFVEALRMKGKGRVRLTGYLGEVMKESAEAAISFVRANYTKDVVEKDFFDNNDIHLHIPAGAVPKDGPSAGIALAVAVASIALDRKVRNDVSMTGEITLTGKVLPVGAVKDKVIAAHRAGIRNVVLPDTNRKDLDDIPDKIRKDLKFKFVNRLPEAISFCLNDRIKE